MLIHFLCVWSKNSTVAMMVSLVCVTGRIFALAKGSCCFQRTPLVSLSFSFVVLLCLSFVSSFLSFFFYLMPDKNIEVFLCLLLIFLSDFVVVFRKS